MFSNDAMMKQETWNDILSAMVEVRDAHGWTENGASGVPEAAPRKASNRTPAKP